MNYKRSATTKAQPSASKILLIVFWDMNGIVVAFFTELIQKQRLKMHVFQGKSEAIHWQKQGHLLLAHPEWTHQTSHWESINSLGPRMMAHTGIHNFSNMGWDAVSGKAQPP